MDIRILMPMGILGSLEIPGIVVSLEIPEIVVSLEIPVFRIFLVKILGKIVKIVFSDSRDQNKILKFLWFFYVPGISYINPYFRAPSPLKPLKTSPRYRNLPGEPLIAYSEPKKHRKRSESTKIPPNIDLCWPFFPSWTYPGSLKS